MRLVDKIQIELKQLKVEFTLLKKDHTNIKTALRTT